MEKSHQRLQEFKREQFEKHQVLIDIVNNPCTIWMTGEMPKMNRAVREVASLIDKMRIQSCGVRIDPLKMCFLRAHMWSTITEKAISCNAEGVDVNDIGSGYLEITGTQAGRNDMITFLEELSENVEHKVCILDLNVKSRWAMPHLSSESNVTLMIKNIIIICFQQ